MSEYQVNARRHWKAETFPYDYYLPDETRECNYCLTEKQAEILRGIIEPLAWHTRWWSDSDTPIDRDTIQTFRDDIIRRLMMGCCGDETPIQFRYTTDGMLQKSSDGGATWEDAPEFDTRVNSPQFPPMEGTDGSSKKCIAATGASALLKEQVGDNLSDDMTRAALLAIITGWVTTFINTSNPLLALATVVNNLIFAVQIVLLRPALTDTVYSIFKCILFCNMSSDATVTEAQWATIRAQITSQIGGIAGTFLERLVYLLGYGGLTNLIRAGGAIEGDCSDCDACPTCETLFVIYGSAGTIVSMTDDYIEVSSESSGLTGQQTVALTSNNDNSCCCVQDMKIGESSVNFTAAWALCGETVPTGAFPHAGLTLPNNTLFNTFLIYQSVAFTVKIYFGGSGVGDCP